MNRIRQPTIIFLAICFLSIQIFCHAQLDPAVPLYFSLSFFVRPCSLCCPLRSFFSYRELSCAISALSFSWLSFSTLHVRYLINLNVIVCFRLLPYISRYLFSFYIDLRVTEFLIYLFLSLVLHQLSLTDFCCPLLVFAVLGCLLMTFVVLCCPWVPFAVLCWSLLSLAVCCCFCWSLLFLAALYYLLFVFFLYICTFFSGFLTYLYYAVLCRPLLTSADNPMQLCVAVVSKMTIATNSCIGLSLSAFPCPSLSVPDLLHSILLFFSIQSFPSLYSYPIFLFVELQSSVLSDHAYFPS